ncbi:MAG: SDR family NAD(P)-dependent oxidoreductase, partial [Bacteroidetes bacterium]|nr:SDR family NAD(P)-dependent oxidoreductase [Bacteroidota bacterium]
MSNRVLVTGATGKQGGAVARALIENGYRVKVLTRNPASPAAGELRKLGAEITVGDMTHEDSLAQAIKGVSVVFAMTTPFQSSHDAEVAQGVSIV